VGDSEWSVDKGYVSVDVVVEFPEEEVEVSSEGMNEDGFTVSCLTFRGAEY